MSLTITPATDVAQIVPPQKYDALREMARRALQKMGDTPPHRPRHQPTIVIAGIPDPFGLTNVLERLSYEGPDGQHH